MTVRELRGLADVRGVVRLYRQVWKNSFGIVDLLAEASTGLVLVDASGAVAGYAFVQEDARRGFGEVVDIAVSARLRGRGYGRQLLAALQDRYPALKLVARGSSRLLRFYRDMGFQEEGRFENYYAAGRDGVRLAWRRAPAGGRRYAAPARRSGPAAKIILPDGASRTIFGPMKPRRALLPAKPEPHVDVPT
jgi:ribosomal protein S18 acetylase RimI-like enzyme